LINKISNVLVWAGWYPKDENSYNGIFVKKHLQIIGKKYNLRIFHITNHHSFSFKVNQNKTDYGLERIYFIPEFKIFTFFAFLIIPVYEYFSMKPKADVLHLHCSYPIILFAFILKLFGFKKNVLTEHWSGYTTYDGAFDRMPFFLKAILRRQLSSLSAISVVSNVLKEEMYKRNLLSPKTIIIPNVVSVPAQFIDNKPKNHISFCTICTLEDKTKNISGMIRAFKKALLKNENLRFTIYGNGIDEQLLINFTKEQGLLDTYIFFKGYVPNSQIAAVYFSHHVFISFSNYETFSISTAEALTHGLPVIVSKSGGPQSFVNQQNGILVNCANEDELSEAIVSLAENIEKYDCNKVSNTMKDRFSEKEILKGFDQLYT
jgi:glycosyltransferase involved in cell wall biosynthesis